MNEEKERQRIVEYALGRFLAEGFRRVRTDDLAAGMGISKKTIYRLFVDKKAILRAAVRWHLAGLEAELARTFDRDSATFREQIAALFRVIGERLAPIQPGFLEDLFRSAPDVWEEIDTYRREHVLTRVAATLRSGVREGYVHPDVDIDIWISLLLIIIQHVVSPQALTTLQRPLKETLRQIQLILFEGVLTDAGRRLLEETHVQP